ncbi:MAG: C40 family peptidase [Candidatus Omnitrophica bacterium]|nr:C40 family peptidase [Candidatus Omnitrophota bacterium]
MSTTHSFGCFTNFSCWNCHYSSSFSLSKSFSSLNGLFSHQNQWQGYPGWIRKDNVRFIEKRPEYTLVVNCPAANIVNAPENNPEIITPVLAGTKFENIGGKNDFYKVRLPDGGIGWVSKQAVTRIQPLINNARSRERIVTAAKLFLGVPYVWGGRSMQVSFMPEIATGVDCSGLVNLAYRLNWGDIARDAHEQWMTARPIAAEELQPADLIFLSKPDKHDVITHVMLSLGGEDFIEAPGTGTTVRICDFKTKFGLGRRGLQAKQYIVNARKLYFGRIIP